MIFVTSWDDGHPNDLRLADMLSRHDLLGTFFVPLRNSWGKTVMSAENVRAISTEFEIGSHTADHIFLDALSTEQAISQVRDGKLGLEQMLGTEVHGFCYPGGKLPKDVNNILRSVGVHYARTVENLRLDAGNASFCVPTTLQFYPHRPTVLLKNMLRHPWPIDMKLKVFKKLATAPNNLYGMLGLMEDLAETNCIFHIWGHGWEIDAYNLWNDLEIVLKRAALLGVETRTIGEVVAMNVHRDKL